MNGFAIRSDHPPELDVEWLLDRFEAHRRRLSSRLRELSAEEWLVVSRCSEWTVHDVTRHLCDTTAIMADDASGPSKPFDRFDARTTPRLWLQHTDGEPVEETMRRLDALTESFLRSSRHLLDEGASSEVLGPYGPVHWTTLVLHGFWDSWLHERDALLPLGRPCMSDPEEAALAAAYGLFLAGKAASWSGTRVEDRLELGGTGGGTYEWRVDGSVTVQVSPAATSGPETALVADSLAGRGDELTAVLPRHSGSLEALGALSRFFRS